MRLRGATGHAPAELSPMQSDALTERIMHSVNATGEVFLSHTKVRGRYAIRMSIGNIRSDETYVARAWSLLREAMVREATR